MARVKVEPGASSGGCDVDIAMEVENDDDNDNNNNNGEDEIVREMDVYLSPQLARQLHLLQFPLQHAHTAMSSSLPDVVRMKPRHNMMEMDQRIPSNIETEGNFQMEYRTFASHTIPIATHLTLGQILSTAKDGGGIDDDTDDSPLALHLVPLTHITQMRPTFAHVDAHMDAQAGGDEDAAMEQQKQLELQQQQSNEKQEKKPLIYQKKESERAALARKSSYAYKKASEEGEEWLELRVIPRDDDEEEYAQLIQQVACSELDAHVFTGSDASKVYIRSLNYLPVNTSKSTITSSTSTRAMTNTGTSSTNAIDISEDEEHAESWMIDPHCTQPVELSAVVSHLTTLLHKRGGPIPFSILRHSLPSFVRNDDIASALTTCAVMVQGNFVLQSRLLSLPPVVAKARTFLLLLLQSIGCIHRSRLERSFGDGTDEEVPPETLLTLLQQVAHKTSHGWVLKVHQDDTVTGMFPRETALYMQYWGRQVLRFEQQLNVYSL